MGYDTPEKIRYVIPSSAFGAAAENIAFMGPPGKTGYVRNIEVEVTADMVGTTSVPEIVVGATAAASEYARFRLGSTAILGYTAANTPFNAKQLVKAAPGNTGGVPPSLIDYAGHILLERARLPADTKFFISAIAGVGGSPAGTARREVEIEWF